MRRTLRAFPSIIAIATMLSALAGCDQRGANPGVAAASSPRVIARDSVMPMVAWTDAECAKPVAARLLRATDHSSTHLIRLGGAETPHTHDTHDLTVVMLSGGGVLHIGSRTEVVHPGDVMEIPRGTVHWAENTDPAGSVVYAVFTPPYDGTDLHPVGSRQF